MKEKNVFDVQKFLSSFQDVGKETSLNLKLNLSIVNALWLLLSGERFSLEGFIKQSILESMTKVTIKYLQRFFRENLQFFIQKVKTERKQNRRKERTREIWVHSKYVVNFCSKSGLWKLKFIYSEKATKFCEIFTLLLTVCTVLKSELKILQNFVAFSEYMNFIKCILKPLLNVVQLYKGFKPIAGGQCPLRWPGKNHE